MLRALTSQESRAMWAWLQVLCGAAFRARVSLGAQLQAGWGH